MNELNIDALRKKVAKLSASFKIVRRDAVEYVGFYQYFQPRAPWLSG